MASWLVISYEKMLSWVHKAFLAYWQPPEYIWECCVLNLMSQNGNCSMQWLHIQCCVKSSHKELILVQYYTIWLFIGGFGQGENWSHILETSLQDPLPTLCLSIYKCIPLDFESNLSQRTSNQSSLLLLTQHDLLIGLEGLLVLTWTGWLGGLLLGLCTMNESEICLRSGYWSFSKGQINNISSEQRQIN